MDIMMVGLLVIPLIVILMLFFSLVNLYQKCRPNEAIIITGAVPGGIQIVRGGGAVVWPLINQKHSISLEVMTVKVDSGAALTATNGAPVHLEGVAHVKVEGSEEAIVKAAERFLGKTAQEITKIAQEILIGHLRAVVATMTVDEIAKGLEPLAQRVQDTSSLDLAKMGLVVESFSIK